MTTFPAEVTHVTEMAQGHIVCTLNNNVGGGDVEVGRVVGLGDMDNADTWEEYTDYDANSVERRVSFIKRAYARGDLEVTIDSLLDPTVYTGMGWSVLLEQQYPASATPPDTGFSWTADLALITCTNVLNPRGNASQTKISIKPYALNAATAAVEIDVAADYTPA
jgi:hypothetical protein